MSDHMTAERLVGIAAMAAAATKGPWEIAPNGEEETDALCYDFADLFSVNATYDDWRFVAHARQDVPELLAEVELQKLALDELEKDYAEFRREIRGALFAYWPNNMGVLDSEITTAVKGLAAEVARLEAENERLTKAHIWCDTCESVQPLILDDLPANHLNDHAATDLVCGRDGCHFVIATLHHLEASDARD